MTPSFHELPSLHELDDDDDPDTLVQPFPAGIVYPGEDDLDDVSVNERDTRVP